jgi:hypothetical protein
MNPYEYHVRTEKGADEQYHGYVIKVRPDNTSDIVQRTEPQVTKGRAIKLAAMIKNELERLDAGF